MLTSAALTEIASGDSRVIESNKKPRRARQIHLAAPYSYSARYARIWPTGPGYGGRLGRCLMAEGGCRALITNLQWRKGPRLVWFNRLRSSGRDG